MYRTILKAACLFVCVLVSGCAFVARTVDIGKIEPRITYPPNDFSSLYHVHFGRFDDRRANKEKLGVARNKLMMVTTSVSMNGDLSGLYEKLTKQNFASSGIGEGDSPLIVKGSILEAKTDARDPDNIYVQIKASLTILNMRDNTPLFNKVLKGYEITPVTQISNSAWEDAFIGAMNQISEQIQLIALKTTKLLPKEIAEPNLQKLITEDKARISSESYYNKVAGGRWAVVIGTSRYQDTRIPYLRYASKDAKAFYDWAVSRTGGKYAPSRVKLLLDQKATGRNIKNALFVWLGQALGEDVVTIYFAGHGSPQSPDNPDNLFLLPYDASYDDVASTGFPMWDIETALKRFIKAKKVVVIADACHAGGVGQAFDVARRANRAIKVNPISSGLQNLSKVGDGVCVISASDEKQFSQESKDWGGGHGVFTYFLLKGLEGEADYNKDNRVTLGELIPYLSEQVRRATRNVQSPTVAGKFDPALSIGG